MNPRNYQVYHKIRSWEFKYWSEKKTNDRLYSILNKYCQYGSMRPLVDCIYNAKREIM